MSWSSSLFSSDNMSSSSRIVASFVSSLGTFTLSGFVPPIIDGGFSFFSSARTSKASPATRLSVHYEKLPQLVGSGILAFLQSKRFVRYLSRLDICVGSVLIVQTSGHILSPHIFFCCTLNCIHRYIYPYSSCSDSFSFSIFLARMSKLYMGTMLSRGLEPNTPNNASLADFCHRYLISNSFPGIRLAVFDLRDCYASVLSLSSLRL